MKVKAKEVAAMLGLSEATVSLALNGKPGVSERTRQKVLQCVSNLQENMPAVQETLLPERSLQKKCIKAIVYISSAIYYDDLMGGLFSRPYLKVYQMASERGMDVRLMYIGLEDDIEQILAESETDGTAGIFLMASAIPEELQQKIAKYTGPVPVMIDGVDGADDESSADSAADVVMIDNRDAVYQCMNYLRKRGHREILFCENSASMYNFNARKRAFLQYCRQEGLLCGEQYCLKMGETIEEAYKSMQTWIQGGNPQGITAILAENYSVAVGCIRALQDAGRRIPEDMSVIGIDDLPEAVLLDFKYTHIRIDHEVKTQWAMNCLFARIDGQRGERIKIYTGTRLIPGESVKKL